MGFLNPNLFNLSFKLLLWTRGYNGRKHEKALCDCIWCDYHSFRHEPINQCRDDLFDYQVSTPQSLPFTLGLFYQERYIRTDWNSMYTLGYSEDWQRHYFDILVPFISFVSILWNRPHCQILGGILQNAFGIWVHFHQSLFPIEILCLCQIEIHLPKPF